MSFLATAIGGTVSIISGVVQSNDEKAAARAAGRELDESNDQQIAEERRQFDEIKKLLQPYISSGTTALTQQMNLIGLGGPEAQQTAIQQIEESPRFQALTQQGENALLQSASATGGLRGGNTQGALATLRPNLLSNEIDRQYANLAGISRQGQAAAGSQSSFGQATGANVSNLLGQQGQIGSGVALAEGNANLGLNQSVLKGVGSLLDVKRPGVPQSNQVPGEESNQVPGGEFVNTPGSLFA